MAWTDPNLVNWEVGDPVTSADMKTYIRDNLLALKDPPSANYELNESSNYTTTNTAFVDVDATNLSLTISTKGGDVMVHFHATLSGGNNYLWLDVDMDGTRIGGDDGMTSHYLESSQRHNVTFTRLITGLAAGSHTFKLQWKTNTGIVTLYAGAGTTDVDVHPQFWVREVS